MQHDISFTCDHQCVMHRASSSKCVLHPGHIPSQTTHKRTRLMASKQALQARLHPHLCGCSRTNESSQLGAGGFLARFTSPINTRSLFVPRQPTGMKTRALKHQVRQHDVPVHHKSHQRAINELPSDNHQAMGVLCHTLMLVTPSRSQSNAPYSPSSSLYPPRPVVVCLSISNEATMTSMKIEHSRITPKKVADNRP